MKSKAEELLEQLSAFMNALSDLKSQVEKLFKQTNDEDLKNKLKAYSQKMIKPVQKIVNNISIDSAK